MAWGEFLNKKASAANNDNDQNRGFVYRLTSEVSSLGQVSKTMANPWKLAMLPYTGPAERESSVSPS